MKINLKKRPGLAHFLKKMRMEVEETSKRVGMSELAKDLFLLLLTSREYH